MQVYAAILNAFVAPMDAKVSRPWFNRQTGTAYATNGKLLVRVSGLCVEPCECSDWSTAPKNLDGLFEGLNAVDCIGFRSVYRAAEIALARSRVKNAQAIADEIMDYGDRAYVRVDGIYFSAEYVRRLCMACAMVYDGVHEPCIMSGSRLLCMSCGSVQAIAAHFYGLSDSSDLYGLEDVVCDARTLEIREG